MSIVHGYWDPIKKVSRTKTVKTLGYLDELEKEYPDPIAHFEQIVAEMNQAEAEKNQPITITVNLTEKIKDVSRRMLYGYSPLSRIYHDLDIHSFVNSRARSLNVKYIPNNILKLLCFERLLNPGSKKKAYENKDRYFENTDFSLDDVYGFLSLLVKYKDDLQIHLHDKIKTLCKRTTDLVYYDVTNYYFEIDQEDDLKKRGVSKEHRPDPIIQMGLFMDTMGIPISYQLFPGNTNDCETVRPMLAKLKRDYDIGRVIVVADKGNNTAKNVKYHGMRGDGYVYSQTVRGGQKELKDYVFDEDGYTWIGEDYKIKSRVYPREISVIGNNGKLTKKRIEEKQIIFYSRDYDRRAKAEREPTLKKAMELIRNPAKYSRATSYGAAKYVKNLEYDKETGEILTVKKMPTFDEEKLREEERFDGYYAIVTSELDKSDQEIIEIYRGLWRIEESFKVTKSDLKTRPVFLSRQDRIESHFLICFIALTIIRILQHKLNGTYSATRILDSLRKIECTNVEENIYIFDYQDDVIRDLGATLGIDLSRKYMTFGEIKKSLGDVKKPL